MRPNHNRIKYLELLEKIIERSDSEIKRITSIHSKTLYSLTIIFTVGIGFAYFLISNSISGLKDELRTEMEFFADSLKLKTEKQIDFVKQSVLLKVDSEFDKKNIQDLVKTKATERVDSVAVPLISEEVSERIKDSEKKLNKLIFNTQYQLLEFRAINDDRFAFDSLNVLANSIDPVAVNAIKTIKKIINEYKVSSIGYLMIEGENYNLPLQELKRIFLQKPKDERSYIIYTIEERKDIDDYEKDKFFIYVLKNDPSLNVVAKVMEKLLLRYKLDLKLLEYHKFLELWDNNFQK